MRYTLFLIAILLAGPALPPSAGAAPDGPVSMVPAPEGQGEMFSPPIRLVADLEQDYAVEEYLVSGQATVYTYNWDPNDPNTPPVRGDIVPVDPNVPYTTRIIIHRPSDPNVFNGTVVIEWWNSSAGFDTAPSWDASAEYFARKGIVYLGVTNSTTSLEFLTGGCSLFGMLPPTCGTRYETLSMPENGQAFEMVSQIANLLKSSSPENPLHPDYPVERIFHVGQSQQGGSMVTYASAFHFPGINDGYFIQAAGRARRINYRTSCNDPNAPPYPECTPRLEGEDRLVRTDLPVPVYRAHTETDMAGVLTGDSRQIDTDTFRYYEMTGTAHSTVHKDIEVIPGLYDLEDMCRYSLNTLADGPIFGSFLYNAMWENMELQVRDGTPPPSGVLIETEVDPNGLLVTKRDAFGNAQGGIRLPQMDVPIASYSPNNEADPNLPAFLQYVGNLACRLSGSVEPFDAGTLDGLYPKMEDYLVPIEASSQALIDARFLLPEDAVKFPVPQVKQQQKCINALNKNLEKVSKTQGKDIAKCIKDGSKGKLSGDHPIEVCIVADNDQKVAKATAKTVADATSSCRRPWPSMGPTDPDIVNQAGVAKDLDLIHDIFGSDLDEVIIDAGTDKAGAKCQVDVTKAVQKCQSTRLKEFNKCKKDGLKKKSDLEEASFFWFDDPGDLELCLGLDPKGKIDKSCNTKLVGTVTKKCPAGAVDTDAAFPGCAGEDLVTCLNRLVICRVCRAASQADDLDHDCDELDDGTTNGSCP
jgi:hypothetical protein